MTKLTKIKTVYTQKRKEQGYKSWDGDYKRGGAVTDKIEVFKDGELIATGEYKHSRALKEPSVYFVYNGKVLLDGHFGLTTEDMVYPYTRYHKTKLSAKIKSFFINN